MHAQLCFFNIVQSIVKQIGILNYDVRASLDFREKHFDAFLSSSRYVQYLSGIKGTTKSPEINRSFLQRMGMPGILNVPQGQLGPFIIHSQAFLARYFGRGNSQASITSERDNFMEYYPH